MSTRCNIVIQDSWGSRLYFYRHSDGYPEVTKKSLEIFMNWIKEGRVRDNVGQAAGWLIILGAAEYDINRDFKKPDEYGAPLHTPLDQYIPNAGHSDWKVGAYEPTTDIHGDIEYLYIIDLEKQKLTVKKSGFDKYKRAA